MHSQTDTYKNANSSNHQNLMITSIVQSMGFHTISPEIMCFVSEQLNHTTKITDNLGLDLTYQTCAIKRLALDYCYITPSLM